MDDDLGKNNGTSTDENLLSPSSEISNSEREEDVNPANKAKIKQSNVQTDDDDADAKTSVNSLPDARAKELRLQRVQRSKDDEEKEETVSFSLESIIRRGLNEQKLNTNFKSNLIKIDPSDDISLRVNPTADLFYEHENSNFEDEEETTSESYESEKQGSDSGSLRQNKVIQPAVIVDENETETNEENDLSDLNGGDDVPVKRKRGRPKLSVEEKMKRQIKTNLAKRSRKESVFNLRHQIPNVLIPRELKIEHSIFSEETPRRRGRRRKEQPQQPSDEFLTADSFSDANIHSNLNPRVKIKRENGDVINSDPSENQAAVYQNSELTATETHSLNQTEQSADIPVRKKRGPKPKNKQITFEQTPNVDRNYTLSTSLPANGILTSGKKKRGRKPKNLDNYYIKLNETQIAEMEARQDNNVTTHNNNNNNNSAAAAAAAAASMTPLDAQGKKKRGRKPKSFYLQQMGILNQSAPAQLQRRSIVSQNVSTPSPLNSGGILSSEVLRKKRGRKPKSYYEQLAQLSAVSTASNVPVITPKLHAVVNISPLNVSGPKKRGRKPKSYYLQLQQQQQTQQSPNYDSTMGNHSTPIDYQYIESEASSRNRSLEESGETSGMGNMSAMAYTPVNKKRVVTFKTPKIIKRPSTLKQKLLLKKKLIAPRKLKKPLIATPGIVVHKKRGPKPKNINANVSIGSPKPEEGNSSVANSGYLDSYNKALQDRNKALLDILEQRSDEIRNLKLRLANLTSNEKKEDEVRENLENSISWTNAELCKAFSLQKLSSPLFNYMRDKFSIPLPRPEEVKKFTQDVQLTRGLQKTMLQILENDGEILRDYERVTILQISYINTVELFEYDENTDNILGPHKYLALVVARGLYKDWSQLIYLNFDTKVNKQNLNCAIEALYKVKFNVAGCVSNFQESKSTLWSELDIGYGKNFFLHPITNEHIYAFYYLDDLLAATNKHFIDGCLALDSQQLNKDTVMQAIQKNYRRISIEKGILEWADADINNIYAINTFFSQYTINLLKMSSPDDSQTKCTTEFINIVKSLADIMNKKKLIDVEMEAINFDTQLDFLNKKLNKVHARLFKLQYVGSDPASKKFREAIMMSVVSLKMLQSSVTSRYKYTTFSPYSITNEFLKQRISEVKLRNNFNQLLPPLQVFRILKEIFLDDNCTIKLEPKDKLFFSGPLVQENEKNEAFYVNLLIQWLCERYRVNYSKIDMRRILQGIENSFLSIQHPNFRITESVVAKVTKKLSVIKVIGFSDLIRIYVLQRHLLRIKFLNENGLLRVPAAYNTLGNSSTIVDTITLEE